VFGGTYNDALTQRTSSPALPLNLTAFSYAAEVHYLTRRSRVAARAKRMHRRQETGHRFQWNSAIGSRWWETFSRSPGVDNRGSTTIWKTGNALFNYEYLSETEEGSALPTCDTVGTFVVQAASPENVEGAGAIDKNSKLSAPTKTETEPCCN